MLVIAVATPLAYGRPKSIQQGKGMATALVTGTSTGIGYATAIHLARNGYKTYATMRNLDKGAPLREVAESESLPLELLALDVTDETSMSNGVAKVLAADGRIDVLVNNAGIGEASPLEFLDQALLRNTMETNFFGAVRMMQLVLPCMREQQSGTIVNITSLSGLIAFPAHGAYCASKFGLAGFGEALREELRPHGILVVNVFPGQVDTGAWDACGLDLAALGIRREQMMEAADVGRALADAVLRSGSAVPEELILRPPTGG